VVISSLDLARGTIPFFMVYWSPADAAKAGVRGGRQAYAETKNLVISIARRY
jgi:hypothetical protein